MQDGVERIEDGGVEVGAPDPDAVGARDGGGVSRRLRAGRGEVGDAEPGSGVGEGGFALPGSAGPSSVASMAVLTRPRAK